jgi:hypothetical protein
MHSEVLFLTTQEPFGSSRAALDAGHELLGGAHRMEVLCLVAAAVGSCSTGQQSAPQAVATAVQLPVVAQDDATLPAVSTTANAKVLKWA